MCLEFGRKIKHCVAISCRIINVDVSARYLVHNKTCFFVKHKMIGVRSNAYFSSILDPLNGDLSH